MGKNDFENESHLIGKRGMKEPRVINLQGLVSGRTLAKNTILNLIGMMVPMVVGLVAIPILIKHLGTDRFGIITIVWMLIGYFSLFDMGLGRALTQLVSEKLGKNELEDIPAIFWTSLAIMLVFAIVGSLCIGLVVSPLIHGILKVPIALQSETVTALHIMVFSIPFVILSAALVGFLTAYHRFDIINAIRIPMGIFNFVAPLIVLLFTRSLVFIILSLVVLRIVLFLIQLYCCLHIAPGLRTKLLFKRSIIKPLLKFGGWMTVSNIVSPLMMYFDRFFIGSILSVTAVAYYTTPYELITKLLVIPGALISVLFPSFASIYSHDVAHATRLLGRTINYLLICLFPIVLIIVTFASSGLSLWLGDTFASNSYRVLQWLAIGVFLNSLAQVPFAFLQGIGKPEITSKLHLMELGLYLPLLWYLVSWKGIEGAAIAWCIRVAIDTLCLFMISHRFYRPLVALPLSTIICIFVAIPASFILMLVSNRYEALTLLIIMLLIFMFTSWYIILTTEDRSFVKSRLPLL